MFAPSEPDAPEGAEREVEPWAAELFGGEVVEKKDTGLGPIADYPTAFFGLGVVDSIGLAAAGLGGMTHAAVGEEGDTVQMIEAIANDAYENYTLPLINTIDPNDDSLLDAHTNIGEAIHWLVNGAGTAATYAMTPPVKMAELAGLMDKDTATAVLATANAYGQVSAVAAMIAVGQGAHAMMGRVGGRTKPGPKKDRGADHVTEGTGLPRLTYKMGDGPESRPARSYYTKEAGEVHAPRTRPACAGTRGRRGQLQARQWSRTPRSLRAVGLPQSH
jgi:hypothetical protein